MAVVTERLGNDWGMGAAAAVVAGTLLLAVTAHAQPLPRIEGPLTMEQAVDIARQKSLRVKAAGADARVMDSMRREALAPFWPQLSANGYFADQRMAPNVYSSAGNTMAKNYQLFNSDQTRDGNFTAMYPLFSGGRDWYTYKAAARPAQAGRQKLRNPPKTRDPPPPPPYALRQVLPNPAHQAKYESKPAPSA